jgi:Uma2 family endonuclease
MSTTLEPRHTDTTNGSAQGQPVWELAHQFPLQGDWTEANYLALDIGRLVEFDNGHLKALPVPSAFHQFIVGYVYRLLFDFVTTRQLGHVLQAPLPVRLWPGKFREPDVLFLRPERLPNPHLPLNGTDLVIEVVSEGGKNRDRDLVEKTTEYARAGISEYWIVDPELREITVLVLEGGAYRAD